MEADDNRIVLRARNVTKTYAGVKVLDDVRLDVRAGEVLALMGENGAGKSTLIKIITGVVKADAGDITYMDEPLKIQHPVEIYAKNIGIVHQEFNLLPDLSVAQNMFIAREPMLGMGIVDEARLTRKAREIMEGLNIPIDVERKVAHLSVAEQQLVEIAKALSYDCKLLILDEPTAALAEKETEMLFRVVNSLKAQGVAIIFVSHRMSDIWRIVDRVTVLRDGKFIAEHKLSEATEEQLVKEIVGRELTAYFPPKPEHRRIKPMLEVRNLTVNGVIHDVSFTAYSGEILAISGLMGSGRTELAHAIFGRRRADKGEVIINGTPVRRSTPSRSIRRKLGYATEDRKKDGLMLNLSIKDNVVLSSYDRFMNRLTLIRDGAAAKATDREMKRLQVRATDRNQLVKYLSGGNQQKVALAKWLLTDVDVLIMDEPTRGIDIGAKMEIYNLIHELVQKGVCVIFISSELPEIIGLSHRVLIMNKGRLAGDFETEGLTQERIYSYSAM
ncbi:MAG: sugar ABC transporter ATP-binding protein [Clostridiales bacterium]|nr:sugar ABC transporter ATP-binding protein [Clostridiales bacterium]